jgi:hypothetical protein
MNLAVRARTTPVNTPAPARDQQKEWSVADAPFPYAAAALFLLLQ